MEARVQPSPNLLRHVRRRRNHLIERRNFVVQKTMVHRLDDLFLYDLLHALEIDNHPSNGIGIAFQSHLDNVIVTVTVQIRFLAEELLILGITEPGQTADVRSRKFGSSGDKHYRFLDAVNHS